MMQSSQKSLGYIPMAQLVRLLSIIILLPIIGAIGFSVVENLGPIDSLYMSFITLSTVGYEVVKPLSDSGKIFVICFLVIGFAIFFYSLSQLGEMLVKGDLKEIVKRRIMDKQNRELSGHAIICGLGRMGQSIARELSNKGRNFIIIDLSQDRIDLALREGWRCIKGDASDDSVLISAGIEKAKCLTTVLPHDPDNLFCVMAARLLNRNLTIIARSNSDGAVSKLKRAGATRTVSPYSTGAIKISQLMIHPELEDFMEIFNDRETGVDLTVVEIDKNSIFYGSCLKDIDFESLGVVAIGLQQHGLKMQFPPRLNQVLDVKDVLIVIGNIANLNKMLR